MGESTCLVSSLSFASPIPNETNNHGNHVHALGDSVSFGRFTSESLAWEKWSAFSHKRYVEEAKSYAQPGSVAQKKAFFEAHYKRVAAQKAAAAAALLEQETATASSPKSQVEERVCGTKHAAHDLEPKGISNTHSSETTVMNSKMGVNEEQQIITQNASKPIDANEQGSVVNLVKLETDKIVAAADLRNEELLKNTENLEDHSKLNTDQEVLQPRIRRKPATPSFRSSSNGRKQSRIPPSPAKYVASMHPRKENMVTPRTKNSTAIDPIDKKRSAPRSLYTLMNSGSVRESCKVNPPAVRKIESTKPAPTAHSTPKRCATPSTTPSKVVTNGVNKQPLATPSSKRRMETPVHPSAVGSKTPGQKWHIFSAVSKSLSAYRNKMQSPTVSSPFTLRTEERAARRKQARIYKLEEKFNAKEAQKVQLQTTLKEKAETEFRRLRQSFCFKARPLPSFYNTFETPRSPIKKVDLKREIRGKQELSKLHME
ncbi:hypothetical protein Ccrd_005122 [Cynara cardunculus var. scolymus]|uniref:TPX2 C-terminal domain-containing protein n=1 Tax=Cynara cardunculus var. scolymus TaxID=59895 RepID=A0A103XL87_CYNCS|nr:hypothetical protein Ccrd_005122 [Cynara cardunculus var. scolymus]